MYGIFSGIKSSGFKEDFLYKYLFQRNKAIVMNTQLISTRLPENVKEVLPGLLLHTRSRIISAANIWNIQRRKRTWIQRRFVV